jgi:hypothetical protein
MKALAAPSLAAFLAMGPALAAVPAAGTHAAPQAAAIHWKYQLSDVVVDRKDAEGKPSHQLNIEVLDYFLHTIAAYAAGDRTPPSVSARDDIFNKLTRLTALLAELDHGASTDVNIVRREALAYDTAAQFGFGGASEKADALYRQLLAQDSDEPGTNLLYGSFLARTDKTRDQGITYLQKAVQLGVKQANYTLGVAYVTEDKKPEALTALRQYTLDFPKDERAQRLLAAVKSGDVKRQYQASPAAGTH